MEKLKELSKKTWFVILMLIVFFPIGLYLMWKNRKFNKVVRIVVTIFIDLFVIIGVTGESSEPSKKTSETNLTKGEDVGQVEKPKEKPVDKPAETTIEKPKEEVKSEPQKPIDLKIDISVDNNGGKPVVTVKTNLPDNTEGMITLSNDNANYRASSEITVKNGVAKSEMFSDKGNPLITGTYEVNFSASSTSVQPDNVKSKLGENYSNYVSKDIIRDNGSAYVDSKINFEIKGSNVTEKDVAKKDKDVKSQIQSMLTELQSEYNSKPTMAEWVKFQKGFFERLDVLSEETTDISLKVSIASLKQLVSEYRKALDGRGNSADIEYFINDVNDFLK